MIEYSIKNDTPHLDSAFMQLGIVLKEDLYLLIMYRQLRTNFNNYDRNFQINGSDQSTK